MVDPLWLTLLSAGMGLSAVTWWVQPKLAWNFEALHNSNKTPISSSQCKKTCTIQAQKYIQGISRKKPFWISGDHGTEGLLTDVEKNRLRILTWVRRRDTVTGDKQKNKATRHRNPGPSEYDNPIFWTFQSFIEITLLSLMSSS